MSCTYHSTNPRGLSTYSLDSVSFFFFFFHEHQQLLNTDNMAVHSVVNAIAQSKLTDIGKLIAVRKNLSGSNLPVADLDQIIVKAIENVQKDATAGDLDGNSSLPLEQLNSIRADIIGIGFDITGVDSLIEHTIALACSKMKIGRKVCHELLTYGLKFFE